MVSTEFTANLEMDGGFWLRRVSEGYGLIVEVNLSNYRALLGVRVTTDQEAIGRIPDQLAVFRRLYQRTDIESPGKRLPISIPSKANIQSETQIDVNRALDVTNSSGG